MQSHRAQNLPGGVVRLIYMCAHALKDNATMFGMVAAVGREQYLLAALDINEDGTTMYRNSGERMLGPDPGLPDEEVEAYVRALGAWNGQCPYGELGRRAWRESPVPYLKNLRDLALPTMYQIGMIDAMRAAGEEVEVFELTTGRSPHATMTQKVAEIVHDIVCRAGGVSC